MGSKQYGPPEQYEDKLAKVMQRFGAEEYNFDWGRRGGWVEFRVDGVLYRFDHSVDKARANGQKIQFGSDAFAQLVLALEDLARLTERGIYKLKTWIEGMRYLPPPVDLPECFRSLGFERLPADAAAVNDRFRALAKERHPDVLKDDGTTFKALTQAAEDARRWFDTSQ